MIRGTFEICLIPNQPGIRRYRRYRSFYSLLNITALANQSFQHEQIQPNLLSARGRRVCDSTLSRSRPLRNLFYFKFKFRQTPLLPEFSKFVSPPPEVGVYLGEITRGCISGPVDIMCRR